jgi:hypothetical protein
MLRIKRDQPGGHEVWPGTEYPPDLPLRPRVQQPGSLQWLKRCDHWRGVWLSDTGGEAGTARQPPGQAFWYG